MVYHPLKKLIGAGIKDILLVSGTEHMGDFVELLGSGRDHGCSLTYRVQDEAGGIAQALGLAELFCHGSRCVVILGDNIFHDPLGRCWPTPTASPTGPGWRSSRSTTRSATAWPSCKATHHRHRGEAAAAEERLRRGRHLRLSRRMCSRSSRRSSRAAAANWKSPTSTATT